MKEGEALREYSLKEISESLGIADRTLRRWSVMLEQYGYHFEMNKSTRIYTDTEHLLFSNIKKLTQGITVEEAIITVIRNQNQGFLDNPDVQEELKKIDQLIDGLEEEIYWNGEKKSIESLKSYWVEFKRVLTSNRDLQREERYQNNGNSNS